MSAKDANTPGCCPEDSEPALKVTKSEAGTVVNLTSDLPAYVVVNGHPHTHTHTYIQHMLCIRTFHIITYSVHTCVDQRHNHHNLSQCTTTPTWGFLCFFRFFHIFFLFIFIFRARYVVGSPQAKAALIVAYSIFGFQGQSRIRQVCDQFAAAGFYVILPDYYRGDQWSDERQAKEGREGIVPFIAQFKWAGALENDFKAAVAHAREQPGIGAAGKIGAVGFCWGAWAAVRASTSGEISAAYSAHPSLQVEKVSVDRRFSVYCSFYTATLCSREALPNCGALFGAFT